VKEKSEYAHGYTYGYGYGYGNGNGYYEKAVGKNKKYSLNKIFK